MFEYDFSGKYSSVARKKRHKDTTQTDWFKIHDYIITQQLIAMSRLEGKSSGYPFQLNTKTLKSSLKKKYNTYVDIMLKEDTIELVDDYAQAGQVCRKYRLKHGLNGIQRVGHKSKRMLQSEKGQKLKMERQLAQLRSSGRNIHAHLLEQLRHLRLDQDLLKAVLSDEQQRIAMHMLSEIMAQKADVNWTLSEKTNRLYTIMTQVKREIRRCARWKDDPNQPLAEKDASHSQFWILTILKNRNVYNYLKTCYTKQDLDVLYTLYFDIDQADFDSFEKDVLAGRMYDRLANLVTHNNDKRYQQGELKNRPKRQSREDAKNWSMKLLFGNKLVKGETDEVVFDGELYNKQETRHYMLTFEELYPSVYKFLSKIVRPDSLGKSKFACLLQTVEAWVWLENIADRFCSSGGDRVFTVHDCLVIKDRADQHELFDAVSDGFFDQIGLSKPLIK